jgi:tRNA (guanine37-N1)-methyltransferase
MKIDILTIFPNMFDGFLNESIIKRAIDSNKIDIQVHDFREYSKDPHKKVDDYGFGGGPGMVLMPQPIFDAVEDLRTNDSFVILMTPQGVTYKQSIAKKLTTYKHIIIICGHYEGFDERIRTLADMEISIGDFVLTGGELPSMIICDSVARLLDGVIDSSSKEEESFENNLLDYPVYTRPADFRGMKVPEVLLSGHHANINEWRLNEQKKRTEQRRPDLLERKD